MDSKVTRREKQRLLSAFAKNLACVQEGHISYLCLDGPVFLKMCVIRLGVVLVVLDRVWQFCDCRHAGLVSLLTFCSPTIQSKSLVAAPSQH